MENSNIQWTDHTFNPWEGCTKVSPGCKNCYAENRNIRFAGGANWGRGKPRRRTSAANWKKPLRWDRDSFNAWCAARGKGLSFTEPRRPRVFCASLADWLDDEVPVEWLADLLHLIRVTPNLDWQLLTKRPQNWRSRMTAVLAHFALVGGGDTATWLIQWLDGHAPANVQVGTTTEDQYHYNERIEHLSEIPARIRFLSMEPLLEAVKLELNANLPSERMFRWHNPVKNFVQWVIVGGESGPGARLFNIEWARDIVAQCRANGVAVFVKQFGAQPISGISTLTPIKLTDGHGGDMSEWPADLRVREFPTAV